MIDEKGDRPPVRGILLDKDGTLIDSDATWAPVIRHLVVELVPPGAPEALMEAAGLDLSSNQLRAGSIWAAGSTTELVQLWWPRADKHDVRRLCVRVDTICAALSPKTTVPLLDLELFLDTLTGQGLLVGVATNDSMASLTAFIDHHDLGGRLEHRLGYDSVENPKPAPDMVHAFCDATGLAAAEVVVVGDNTHDLEMARAAGAGWAIGVLTGNGGRDDLAPLADTILDSVADLPDWLADQSHSA